MHFIETDVTIVTSAPPHLTAGGGRHLPLFLLLGFLFFLLLRLLNPQPRHPLNYSNCGILTWNIKVEKLCLIECFPTRASTFTSFWKWDENSCHIKSAVQVQGSWTSTHKNSGTRVTCIRSPGSQCPCGRKSNENHTIQKSENVNLLAF